MTAVTRWAALTVLLYLLCLSALLVPIFLVLSEGETDLLPAFYVWVVPSLLVAQAMLLVVPVATAEGRPVARRSVRSAAVFTALPMGILAAAFAWCLVILVFGENFGGDWLGWVLVGLLLAAWIFWSVLFCRSYTPYQPKAFTASVSQWLLRGSILEMLVAIPSHVVARERNDCCAPAITLWGFATGLSVALLAFGPAVFLLITSRVRAKRGAATPRR